MAETVRNAALNEITNLRAQVMAQRLALEMLWVNVLRAQPDATGLCDRIAGQGHQAIDACYEQMGMVSDSEHVLMQAMLTHHENLWKSIETQLRAQL